jgi:hypothetical protein
MPTYPNIPNTSSDPELAFLIQQELGTKPLQNLLSVPFGSL